MFLLKFIGRKRYYFCIYFLIIGLFRAAITLHAEETDSNHFYFIQITDTYIGEGNHLKVLNKIVNNINNLPLEIKFVVHTGDIYSKNILNENIRSKGMAVLNKLKVPVHFVPGNRDILPERLPETLAAYKKYFGDLISMAEYDNVVFIFIYTEPLTKSFTIEEYKPLVQLEGYLKKSKEKPVILFHHTPSVDNFYGNTMHEGWNDDVREQWIELINKYKVKAVIAGHFQRDEHHWLGKVPLYVSSSIAENGGRQPSYRIYEYMDGRISYRTQYTGEYTVLDPEIVEKEKIYITGMKIESEPSKKTYDQLWKSFFNSIHRFKSLSIDSAYYGLNLMPDENKKMTYIVGVAIEKTSKAPSGYFVHIIPATRYAVFATTVGTVGGTLQFIFNEYLPYSNYTYNREIPFFEKYPEDTKELGDPVYIYIPIH